jgi:predicted RNA-binding protein with PUA-like domain
MRYWLMKTEPDVYSIDDLIRDGKCPWEGVRSYQARNHMRAMKNGDRVLFYHSSVKPPTVVGIAEVCREAYVDPTQFDPKSPYHDEHSKVDKPRWDRVDVKFVERLRTPVTLDTLKEDAALDGMLVKKRGMRLSVQPVEAGHFRHIVGLGKKGASQKAGGVAPKRAEKAAASNKALQKKKAAKKS